MDGLKMWIEWVSDGLLRVYKEGFKNGFFEVVSDFVSEEFGYRWKEFDLGERWRDGGEVGRDLRWRGFLRDDEVRR